MLHSHMGNAGEDDVPLARALGVPHITMFYGADAWQRSRLPGWRETFVPVGAEPFDLPALARQHVETMIRGIAA